MIDLYWIVWWVLLTHSPLSLLADTKKCCLERSWSKLPWSHLPTLWGTGRWRGKWRAGELKLLKSHNTCVFADTYRVQLILQELKSWGRLFAPRVVIPPCGHLLSPCCRCEHRQPKEGRRLIVASMCQPWPSLRSDGVLCVTAKKKHPLKFGIRDAAAHCGRAIFAVCEIHMFTPKPVRNRRNCIFWRSVLEALSESWLQVRFLLCQWMLSVGAVRICQSRKQVR